MSHLDHQDTTVSHRGTSYTGAHEVHPEGAKSVDFVTKSAPHTSLGLQLAGLDIISIEPRHKTSEEPSRPPGDDDITSRYLLPVLESISPQGV